MIIVLEILLGVTVYFDIRNVLVYIFVIRLITDCMDDISVYDPYFKEKYEYAKKIIDKYSYNDYMLSLKPLTRRVWFSKEEVNFINHKVLP